MDIPEHDYGRLQTEIEDVARNKGLQVEPVQVKKVIQLYETMLVRHGVMLVGPTGGGKTTVYQVRRRRRFEGVYPRVPGGVAADYVGTRQQYP